MRFDSNLIPYYNLTKLKLSGGSTLSETYNTIPDNSIFIQDASIIKSDTWKIPSIFGTVMIIKLNNSRAVLLFYGKEETVGDYRMFLLNNNPSGTWRKIQSV